MNFLPDELTEFVPDLRFQPVDITSVGHFELFHTLLHDVLRAGNQLFRVAKIHKALGLYDRGAQESLGIIIQTGGYNENSVLRQVLSISKDNVSDISDAESVYR